MFWKTTVSNHSGKAAEDQALAFLQKKGLTLHQRNYACKSGELDLVMQEKDTLVFVEVRYRKSDDFGSAAESVNRQKIMRLNRTAEHFLQTFKLTDKQPCRFDIITVQPDSDHTQKNSVNWLKNVFGP